VTHAANSRRPCSPRHTVLSNGEVRLTIPRHNPVNARIHAYDKCLKEVERLYEAARKKGGDVRQFAGADAAKLAAQIHEACRQVLRNPHPMEHF